MKKIINILLMTFVITGVSVIPANAEGEATYAVVDSSGRVQNIIVCAASVCGPGGVWGGRMPSDTSCPGCVLVLQVPANPVTGQNQGGFFNSQPTTPSEPDRSVTYNSDKKTFTQEDVTWSAPHTETEVIDSTTITAIINPDGVKSNPAILSATEGLVKEMAMFDQSKTRAQLQAAIQNRLLVIQKYLHRYYVLLNGWLID